MEILRHPQLIHPVDSSYHRDIALADCNKDGWLDIVAANDFTDTIGIFLDYSNGIFASKALTPVTSGGSNELVTDDFKGGIKIDITIMNSGSSTAQTFLNPC